MRFNRSVFLAAVLVLGVIAWGLQRNGHERYVGDTTTAGTLLPTGKTVGPIGTTVDLRDAVVDCVITPDQRLALLKTSNKVAVVAIADGRELSSHSVPRGASLTGIAIAPDGKVVACTNSQSSIQFFRLSGGVLFSDATIDLPNAQNGGPAYPCGVQFLDSNRLAVAASRDNSVMVVDLHARKVIQRTPVDIAPYSILVQDPAHLLVTCWAAKNRRGRPTAKSAGTDVQVDRRGIAVAGSLCAVDLATGKVSKRVRLPLQPTEMASAQGDIFVACANGDAVLDLDGRTLEKKGQLRAGKLSGSAPDSLAVDATGRILYVAFGGLDRIGAYDLGRGTWTGFMRTEWYPSSVRATPAGLIVATAKGIGSRSSPGPKRSVFDLTSSVSCIPNPVFKATLPRESLDGPARDDVTPVPIPERTGEPSTIKHVVYVIKENRTYDQLLGDMREGNGDPDLTVFGAKVTPNLHAIARSFVLLDNYYCNGIISADGHAWATEANATTYYERSRGGWTRSYPFGDDPIATSKSGYIWDDALDHGRSVRNFGEFDYASVTGKENGFSVLSQFLSGKSEEFGQNIGVGRLRSVSERSYPGWNLAIPDILRADRFTRRLRELERTDNMADLTIVYLPQDHTSGGAAGYPSPRAQVADNDLGVGRVLDALSHSRFWSSSVVFIEEDDPQDGFDHVDGHRSICLLAGPYVKRSTVMSHFYNQASVIRTMERILGLPPMNINDAEANVMTDCFQPTPDLRPYAALPNQIRLSEKTPGSRRVTFDLSKPDQVDDDQFNRQIWALSGKNGPYPGH